MLKLNLKIGFIGAGNMGQAMIGALVQSKAAFPANIFVCDLRQEQTEQLKAVYNISVLPDPGAIVAGCDVIIFAVKPQSIDSLLGNLKEKNAFIPGAGKRIFISIAAGIPIKTFESYIYEGANTQQKKQLPILRVMPNTPALVLSGVSGLCANAFAMPEDTAIARTILSAMGQVFEFPESQMDAVTAVSGSGPAYCFYLAEAMTAAAEKLNFSSEDAAAMTLATLKGAVALLENQSDSAGELRQKVTSPGGTTEAAIRVLEDHDVKQHLMDAIFAAARRSSELST